VWHQSTVQHYWLNIVKQQVTGGECPTLKRHVNSADSGGFDQTTFLTQALLDKAIGEHTTQQNAEVEGIINKVRQVAPP